MKNIEYRTLQIANFIVQEKCTIRETAKAFSMAKSTVHYDLSRRLPFLNYTLYKQVKIILKENFEEKNIRGGLATQKKYLKLKENK